jgi:hypothetical protein
MKKGSTSFLKKRSKKLLSSGAGAHPGGRMQSAAACLRRQKISLDGQASCEAPGKSLLVLFFRKELLTFAYGFEEPIPWICT